MLLSSLLTLLYTKFSLAAAASSLQGFSPEPHLHFAAYRSQADQAPTCRVYFEPHCGGGSSEDDDDDNNEQLQQQQPARKNCGRRKRMILPVAGQLYSGGGGGGGSR
jgi:hypothetical protein